jgi:hypothetical protein
MLENLKIQFDELIKNVFKPPAKDNIQIKRAKSNFNNYIIKKLDSDEMIRLNTLCQKNSENLANSKNIIINFEAIEELITEIKEETEKLNNEIKELNKAELNSLVSKLSDKKKPNSINNDKSSVSLLDKKLAKEKSDLSSRALNVINMIGFYSDKNLSIESLNLLLKLTKALDGVLENIDKDSKSKANFAEIDNLLIQIEATWLIQLQGHYQAFKDIVLDFVNECRNYINRKYLKIEVNHKNTGSKSEIDVIGNPCLINRVRALKKTFKGIDKTDENISKPDSKPN